MRNSVHCLMITSVSMTPSMADLLFDTACLMIRGNSRARKLSNLEMEGRLTTSFKEQSFAGISGIEFLAEVETELGKGKIKFLVRPMDSERRRLDWSLFTSEEELASHLEELHSTRREVVH